MSMDTLSTTTPARKLYELAMKYSAPLIVLSLLALVWANIDFHSYERVTHPAHFPVNEILMAFFFLLVGIEVWEARLPGGAFADRSSILTPLIATVGGIVGPIFFYLVLLHIQKQPHLMPGWAVPCATDVAFALIACRIVFGSGPKAHPAQTFLLAIAILDDVAGIGILAWISRDPSSSLLYLGLVVLAVVCCWAVARWYKANDKPFNLLWLVPFGAMSWTGLYLAGIHTTLCLLPFIPLLPHAEKDLGIMDEREHLQTDALSRLKHFFEMKVQWILGLFGLVNVGVILSDIGPGTFIIPMAAMLGKVIFIVGFTYLAIRLSLCSLPAGMQMKELWFVGGAASIAFTVALFMSLSCFSETSPYLSEIKMGAFATLPIGMILSVGFAFALGIGRFERDPASARESTQTLAPAYPEPGPPWDSQRRMD